MSNLTILGDTSGSVVLQAPAIAGSTTITMPAATGTMMVSGNMPAFSAYQSTQQASLSSGVTTKIQFQTEEFDTANCFDNVTNFRFTPNVAGYYQVNGRVEVASSVTYMVLYVYKNGSSFKRFTNTNTATVTAVNGSALIYLNGSTDYIELYCQQGGNQQLVNSADTTYFQAAMIRGA